MAQIDNQLYLFKRKFEEAILTGGIKGKESIIRSSVLINLIHDAVKYELIQNGVRSVQVFPHLGKTKPEIKVAGFLKQKDQDVCVVPRGIAKRPRIISWGPLASEGIQDEFGDEYTRNTLIINVRSQMSSIAKNTDTLFERTFAEALNLHMMYPDAVLGEVYLIPVCEYDESTMDARRITFKQHNTNIAKYISFFGAINKRTSTTEDLYKYERCTLLIVDFRPEIPILYSSTSQLISAGLLPRDFPIEMSQLAFHSFADDILSVYAERFNIDTLK